MVYFNFGKHYDHYNRAMGKYISNKKEYDEEMKKGNYVPFEAISKKNVSFEDRVKDIHPEKAREMMTHVKADKNGKVNLPEKFIDEMKDMGALKPITEKDIESFKEGKPLPRG